MNSGTRQTGLKGITKEVEVVYVNYPNFFYCILVNEIDLYQKLMSELKAFAGDELLLSGSRFSLNILLSFQMNATRKIIGYKRMLLALLNQALMASGIVGKS